MNFSEAGNDVRTGATKLLLALTLVAVSIGGMSSTAKAQSSGSALAAPIEGTWIMTITRVNQGFSFSALQAFTAGGVTLATGTVDRTPPPPISPLYGSWRRIAGDRYAATIAFFAFDPAGNAVAMIKTNQVFQLTDRNELSGAGRALACDIHGDNCVDVNQPITFTAKRLSAQAPE